MSTINKRKETTVKEEIRMAEVEEAEEMDDFLASFYWWDNHDDDSFYWWEKYNDDDGEMYHGK